jgi:A/G-specific adenine glycosylase
VSTFASALVKWQRAHGRKHLPWQGTRDPYRIWLSEIMLQQTQVAAVIPYYERFLEKFPDVGALAAASEDQVLQLWSGLGYYARGRNLHLASKKIMSDLRGRFPKTAEKIAELPGIGRSTAAAIAAFAFGERAAILDGNVKRVLARHHGIAGFPGDKPVEAKLWKIAESLLPKKDIQAYTQALMDLGATVCTKRKPRCDICPLNGTCIAKKKGLIAKLPAPRPKKEIPSRDATWLILHRAGEVLLERRASSGLWGGLWTFPEHEPQGITIATRRELATLEHGFTHFKLRIRPILCEVLSVTPGAESAGRMWIDVDDAKGAAVPAPVRKLLKSDLRSS